MKIKEHIEGVVRRELNRCGAMGFGSLTGGAIGIDIDSLVVVDICLAVEEAFGIEVPNSAIPTGGFDTPDDCVSFFDAFVPLNLPTPAVEITYEQ